MSSPAAGHLILAVCHDHTLIPNLLGKTQGLFSRVDKVEEVQGKILAQHEKRGDRSGRSVCIFFLHFFLF